MPRQLTANRVWWSVSCQWELRKWWIKVTGKDQCQWISVLKISVDFILTPGQLEPPPVKLAHILIILPSLTPLSILFYAERNTTTAKEMRCLETNVSTVLLENNSGLLYVGKLQEDWHSPSTCITPTLPVLYCVPIQWSRDFQALMWMPSTGRLLNSRVNALGRAWDLAFLMLLLHTQF